jgi:hypothetical protein
MSKRDSSSDAGDEDLIGLVVEFWHSAQTLKAKAPIGLKSKESRDFQSIAALNLLGFHKQGRLCNELNAWLNARFGRYVRRGDFGAFDVIRKIAGSAACPTSIALVMTIAKRLAIDCERSPASLQKSWEGSLSFRDGADRDPVGDTVPAIDAAVKNEQYKQLCATVEQTLLQDGPNITKPYGIGFVGACLHVNGQLPESVLLKVCEHLVIPKTTLTLVEFISRHNAEEMVADPASFAPDEVATKIINAAKSDPPPPFATKNAFTQRKGRVLERFQEALKARLVTASPVIADQKRPSTHHGVHQP